MAIISRRYILVRLPYIGITLHVPELALQVSTFPTTDFVARAIQTKYLINTLPFAENQRSTTCESTANTKSIMGVHTRSKVTMVGNSKPLQSPTQAFMKPISDALVSMKLVSFRNPSQALTPPSISITTETSVSNESSLSPRRLRNRNPLRYKVRKDKTGKLSNLNNEPRSTKKGTVLRFTLKEGRAVKVEIIG